MPIVSDKPTLPTEFIIRTAFAWPSRSMPPARTHGNEKVASTILLVDGHSLIHRAFNAVRPLTTSSGQPTNAAYGFVQMLLLLLQTERPDVAILALDSPGPTFRHDMYDQYKANRPPMDEDLVAQLDVIRELAEAMGFVLVETPGYEADDIIGTLCRVSGENGDRTLVVSGDRDLLQLVDESTLVLRNLRGVTDIKRYDAAAVEEEFGVPPSAFVEMKALEGDKSDNIPGVPKVGPKTAADLVNRFGTVEELLQSLERVDNAKLRERLAAHVDDIRLSKQLAAIDRFAPVDAGLLARRWEGLDSSRLRGLLSSLEFASLLDRLPPEVAQDTTFVLARSAEEVGEVCGLARQAGEVGIAIALGPDGPTGLALAASETSACFVPVPPRPLSGGLFGGGEAPDWPADLVRLLGDESIAKIGHGLKDQARALLLPGLELKGYGFDTSIAAYLIAPHRSEQDVASLVAVEFGQSLPPAEGPGEGELSGAALHACAEAAAVVGLAAPLREQLEQIGEWALFEEMEMPLAVILGQMEAAGIAVDAERLDEIGDKLQGMILQLEKRIHAAAGVEFNISSPKQVGEVLFDKLGLPGGKKTKTGWSTAAGVLDDLAVEHEVPRLILEHREYSKLKSTYVDGLVKLVDEDGRIRTTFEQTVAATGRLSSRNPNLQNIPVRTEWGREIRSCFVAGGDKRVLLAADYSQIELRILAHMSRDPNLLEAFGAGEDIHKRTAATIFGVGLEAVDADMRRAAKTVNYAVMYGMGATALGKQLGIQRAAAQEFIDNYFRALPAVKAFFEGMVEQVRRDGYVSTLQGRRRPIPDIQSKNQGIAAYAERAAMNAPLQGTAADIIKVAMVRLAPRLAQEAPGCTMLLQVHDELVFEVARDGLSQAISLVREVMQGAETLDVPLVVDCKVGVNWRDLEPV